MSLFRQTKENSFNPIPRNRIRAQEYTDAFMKRMEERKKSGKNAFNLGYVESRYPSHKCRQQGK